ncbi:MAG: 3,4-dihydroxy-2-butanone-4-phosphate synthase, partial [Gammaproteobacteria bacterium]
MHSIPELLDDLRLGRMIILVDDEDRENEGDLVLAASHVTPEAINFMARHARGLICLTLTTQRCQQLGLPLMLDGKKGENGSQHGTNFTLSIEAATGVSTGISAADRARTVQVAVTPNARPEDLVHPGHVFPIMAQPGGVLNRAGHTEAGCDITRLAGLEPSAVIVEIMNDDGTMARRPDLETFAQTHGLKMGTIADLIEFRLNNERTVECVQTGELDTQYGVFQLHVFRDLVDEHMTHLALVKGPLSTTEPVLVRVHNADPLRDLLGARRDGVLGWSIQAAMRRIASESGVVVLLDHGPEIDHLSSLASY